MAAQKQTYTIYLSMKIQKKKNPGAINILLPYSLKRTIKNIGQLEIIEKMVVY